MYNILALTDFSNNAYNALFYASQLFKKEECTFYILNAYDEHTPIKEINKKTKKKLLHILTDESQEELEHTYHRIMLDTSCNSLHTYKTISINNNLLDGIKKVVEKEEIDFVVMGNKGKTGAKEIFLGSNTIHVIKTIKTCPVLCVPKEIDFKSPKKIAFTTNYEKNYASNILKSLKDMALFTKASIHVLHLDKDYNLKDNQVENKNELLERIQGFEVHEYIIPYKKTKAETINQFIEKEKIDMLLLEYHHHNFFKKIFKESVVFDISFYLNIPFVVIPTED